MGADQDPILPTQPARGESDLVDEAGSQFAYPPPVDQLLALGDVRGDREWRDYPALGLGPEHVPALIRMATDHDLNEADEESDEVWAPLHAWRALGQLRAQAAIEPLLGQFEELDDSDWFTEEMPEVFGLIGPVAIPALVAYLADEERGTYPRVTAVTCLQQIGQQYPEARDDCVAALTRQLEAFRQNDPTLNAFLMLSLTKLQAVEAAPLMERAFAEETVDELVMGDWDDVQVELGLKERPPRDDRFRRLFGLGAGSPRSTAGADEPPASAGPELRGVRATPDGGAARNTRAKARAKRKLAKESRRKNRKRK